MYFQNYRLQKTWLNKSLKILVLEDPSTSNKGPNTVEIWTTSPLPYLLITVKPIELDEMSLSDMQILKTVY